MPNFVQGATAPSGVAVHDGHIYWINSARDTIGRARLDGSHVDQEFIEKIGAAASGIAVDDRHIYWTNAGNGYSAPLGLIGRAKLDGSDADTRFIEAGDTPTGLAVDEHHLYWAQRYLTSRYEVGGYAIARARLDGSEVDQRFVDVSNEVHGVAVNDRYLYWTNSAENAIGRAIIDGTAVNQRCFSPQDVPLGNIPEGLTVDGAHVFWTNHFANTIARANLDGSGLNERFLPTNGVPAELAVTSPQSRLPQPPSGGACVGARAPVLLGTTGVNVDYWADGWGEVAPRYFTNASMGGGTIWHIRWNSWGGQVAEARALKSIYRPNGGFYRKAAVIRLRATDIARCEPGGPLTYTELTVRQPDKPGGALGKPYAWARDMCDPYPYP